jgi:hypothetical protein
LYVRFCAHVVTCTADEADFLGMELANVCGRQDFGGVTMQLIATGKWSKDEKRWRMIVALRPAARNANGLRMPPLRSGFDASEATRAGGAVRPSKDA